MMHPNYRDSRYLVKILCLLFCGTGQVLLNPPEGQLGHYIALPISRQLFLSYQTHSINHRVHSSVPYFTVCLLAVCLCLYLCVCVETEDLFSLIPSLSLTVRIITWEWPNSLFMCKLCTYLWSRQHWLAADRYEEKQRKESAFFK